MSTYLDLDAIYNSTSGGSFTAGGDLSGSSTNQTVIALYGYNLSNATPSSGQVLVWNSGISKWTPTTLSSGSFSAGGDLSGSDTSQTVIALRGTSLNSSIASIGATEDGYALVWDNSTTSWKASTVSVDLSAYALKAITVSSGTGLTGGGDLSANRTLSVDFGTSGTTVCVGNDSRLSDSRAPNGSAGGDLSSTYPNPTVNKIQGVLVNNTAPTDGQVLAYSNIDGYWKPATPSAVTSVTMTGDVSGSSSSNTVDKIKGKSLNALVGTVGASEDGYALVWDNGTSTWKPASVSVDLTPYALKTITISAGTGLTGGGDLSANRSLAVDFGTSGTTVCVGNDSRLSDSRAPNGSASGDLSGSYPGPTVAKIQGNAVQSATYGASQDGYVHTWVNGSSQIQMKPLPAAVTSVTMTGDVSGSSSSNTVDKIKNNAVMAQSLGATEDGYVLTWDNSDNRWEAKIIPIQTATGSAGGDLSGTYPNPTVKSLTGNAGNLTIADSGKNVLFENTSTNAVISIDTVTSDIGQAASLTIQAQNAIGTTVGGDIIVKSGNNSGSIGGDIKLLCGADTKLQYVQNTSRWELTNSLRLNSYTDGILITDSSGNVTAAASISMNGDVGGTNIANVVYKINGTDITTAGGALTFGNVLRVTGTATATWGQLDLADSNAVTGVLPKANQGAQDMVGDVSGNTGASVVDKIKGTSITTAGGALAVGAVLRVTSASDADWGALDLADTDAVTGVLPKGNQGVQDMVGDVSGNTGASVVDKIKGTTITTAGGALAVGAVLRTTAAGTADWGQLDLADSDAVTGVLPKANQGVQDMAGDVSGNTGASVVDKIKGKTLATALSTVGASQDGYVLTWVNGSSEWQAKAVSSGGGGGFSPPITLSHVTKTSNYTITTSNYVILCDTSGGAFTLTLPTVVSGQSFIIKDSTGSFGTNNLTLARAGSEKIEGVAASKTLSSNWGKYTVMNNGTDWFIL